MNHHALSLLSSFPLYLTLLCMYPLQPDPFLKLLTPSLTSAFAHTFPPTPFHSQVAKILVNLQGPSSTLMPEILPLAILRMVEGQFLESVLPNCICCFNCSEHPWRGTLGSRAIIKQKKKTIHGNGKGVVSLMLQVGKLTFRLVGWLSRGTHIVGGSAKNGTCISGPLV